METYITLTKDNLQTEHLCCAIADKKHQPGVDGKRAWLAGRMEEGHVFRKLNAKGKVFIEYAPLDAAWVPAEGAGYLYIYCLWVAGSHKGKGHAAALLGSCIQDAKQRGCSGVCILSAKKKKPFLADRKFMEHHGFAVADTAGDYELLALSFDSALPRFCANAKRGEIPGRELTIYYGDQCPYIPDCAGQVARYCEANGIPLTMEKVDSLQKAKALPCVFNNWAVFYGGQYVTNHLLNEGQLVKLLAQLGAK